MFLVYIKNILLWEFMIKNEFDNVYSVKMPKAQA